MLGSPSRDEAAEYYFTYIDKARTNNILAHLDAQTERFLTFLNDISEARSRYRYEPGKWSFREALHHINDAERVFAFRAIRAATKFLLRGLPPEARTRPGTASGHPVTTRALAFIIAGHVEHHRRVFVERYF